METQRKRMLDPYFTTHQSQYPGYPARMYADSIRPITTAAFTNPPGTNSQFGKTTFQEDYAWKFSPKVQSIRTATSSGTRVNNPQPDEAFITWKLPRRSMDKVAEMPSGKSRFREVYDGVLNEIIKDKMKTTYQCDFLGVEQGHLIKQPIKTPFDWRIFVNRPPDTIARRSYTVPNQEPELVENTSRYGCNKSKEQFAIGAVPSITKDQVSSLQSLTSNTTYDMTYQNNCDYCKENNVSQ